MRIDRGPTPDWYSQLETEVLRKYGSRGWFLNGEIRGSCPIAIGLSCSRR